MTTLSDHDPLFDSHPSLNVSLQDFEAPRSVSRSPSMRAWSPPRLHPDRRLSSDISHLDEAALGTSHHGPGASTHHTTRPEHPRRRSTAQTQLHHPTAARHGNHLAGAAFGYPSQHSGFRAVDDEDSGASGSGSGSGSRFEERPGRADVDVVGRNSAMESPSLGRFSPPAWRRDESGRKDEGFWDRRRTLPAKITDMDQSRQASPDDVVPSIENADVDRLHADLHELDRASRIRLPTGSLSPLKGRSTSPAQQAFTEKMHAKAVPSDGLAIGESNGNFIRFAVRAEVQHRTEPIEAAVLIMRNVLSRATKSYTSTIGAFLAVFFSVFALRALFQPGSIPPVPDLVKVAGLAKSFEPLMFYSENGIQQIGDLQATGVAVWDLSESVRSTNMTSAPIIVKELDDLSETLKTLAIELTRFFSNVDGDVDSILIVMDWARRELASINSTPTSHLNTAFTNIHTLFSNLGVLESPVGSGQATTLGQLTTTLFGPTAPQRTRTTLARTFHEFLSVLEEAINSELEHALRLFGIFAVIENQFSNLARTVLRETSAQESAHDEMLSSLWTKLLGSSSSSTSSLTRKYERNRDLLASIRRRTVANVGVLRDHERKLLTLKANLESLRRKLVSPLLRGNGSRIGIEEQIKGLEDVSGYLGGVREKQKGRLMGMLYGKASAIAGGDGGVAGTVESAAGGDTSHGAT